MFNFKVLCVVSCLFVVAAAMPQTLHIKGGVRQLDGNDLQEAEKTLQDSLTKLAAGDGPHYTISKVYSASVQTVSGSLHKFKVDLEDQNKAIKKCDVSIWSQPWLENGIEVTFECEGDSKLVKKHSA